MAVINFNAREVAPDEGRAGPFPAGWYIFVGKEFKLEPTKEGTGQKITAILEVLEGQFKGRKVFHNFNWINPSEKAMEIGRKQFSALCHATGILDVPDTSVLVDKPFKARVKIAPADGQYEARNEITAFKHVSDASAVDAVTAAAPSAARPAPSAAVPFTPPPTAAAPMAPPAAPAGQQAWTPPAGQQPWTPPAPAAAPAPTPAPTPAAAPPAWTAPPVDPNAQAMQPAPTAMAPATSTPAPTSAPAPAPAPTEYAAAGETPPPWMQQ